MKLTRSAGYALVAVGHIAQCQQATPVLAKDIAKRYKIPLDYLLKILQQLVRANVLRSVRGPRGGFFLTRAPARISLLQIIEAVDGPFVTEASLSSADANATYNHRVISVFQQASKLAAKTLAQANLAAILGLKKQPTKKKKTAKTKKKKTRR